MKKNIEYIAFQKSKIPIVSRRGLVILKLYAGGIGDLEDVRRIFGASKISAEEREYIISKTKKLRIYQRYKKIVGS